MTAKDLAGKELFEGDRVGIITTSNSYISTRVGTFIRSDELGRFRVMVEVPTSWWTFKDSEEKPDSSFWNQLYQIKYNDPEYSQKRGKIMNQLEMKRGIVKRNTTLQLNRVYKLA